MWCYCDQTCACHRQATAVMPKGDVQSANSPDQRLHSSPGTLARRQKCFQSQKHRSSNNVIFRIASGPILPPLGMSRWQPFHACHLLPVPHSASTSARVNAVDCTSVLGREGPLLEAPAAPSDSQPRLPSLGTSGTDCRLIWSSRRQLEDAQWRGQGRGSARPCRPPAGSSAPQQSGGPAAPVDEQRSSWCQLGACGATWRSQATARQQAQDNMQCCT